MTTLTQCPLCGADQGYTLQSGSTYRWWAVHCNACGETTGECRAEAGFPYYAEPPARHENADEHWNAAGEHADGLRRKIAELEAKLALQLRRLGEESQIAREASETRG